jgi:hypothetical protein
MKPEAAVVSSQPAKLMDVLEDLESYILSLDEVYSHWTCGITDDPEQARRVASSRGSEWRCLDAGTELNARQIEIVLRRKGCEGAPHPGGEGAHYIYVYRLRSWYR